MLAICRNRAYVWIVGAGILISCAEPTNPPVTEPLQVRYARPVAGIAVTGALPSTAPQNVTLDVQISGSGFVTGSVARWLLNGQADIRVRTNSTRFVSSSSLVASITIAKDAEAAPYDIEVATPQGKKGIGTEAFTVLPMEELGAPGGAGAYDINTSGVIAGRRSGVCNSESLPVVWGADGEMADLPLPAGFCNASPESIDAQGSIIGVAGPRPYRYVLRWVRQTSDYTVQTALEFPQGVSVDPAGMNDAGHFVGTYIVNGDHPFWWSETTGLVDLPLGTGALHCVAQDVNNADQIVGWCSYPVSMAVVWDSPTSLPVVLPRLAGYTAGYSATTLNNLGDISGMAASTTKGGKYIHAGVRWVKTGATWTAANLGSLGGANPSPWSMNDSGWIVGSDLAAGNTRHAFLWIPGSGMRDLGLAGAESYAWSINNPAAGEETRIVGQSVRQGDFRAVVWKP